MTPFVLSLSDPHATLETVGGKGFSLTKLVNAGLPVPAGFHITTEAYRQFVTANHLQPGILDALELVDASIPTTLEAASEKISALFAKGSIPSEIVRAVTTAYSSLGTRNALPTAVAVRSSATAEDLPGASFAGQQETYLNILGTDSVLEAVKKCWASLWTGRAIAYRIRQNVSPESVALAVVVQELVFANAAGIMFTANPINGNRDEVIINAAWGLGEAVVGGMVTPDTLTVSKQTGRIIRRETAGKLVMTVRTESGTSEVPVPDPLKNAHVLNDKQAAELAKLGADIEKLYEMPMDIEWTLVLPSPERAEGKYEGFAIVQARPITALSEPPLAWKVPHPKAVLARGSFAEFVPEPVSPLFATLAVPIAHQATISLMKGIGVTEDNNYLFAVLNDYVYVGFVFTPKLTWQMIIASVKMFGPIMKTSRQRESQTRKEFLMVVQKWHAREAATLSPSELLAGTREIFTETAKYYNMAQSGPIPTSLSSEATFGGFYKLLVKRKSDPETSAFVFGAENQALRAEKALYDLAMWIREQPELADYLSRTPTNAVCAALQTESSPVPAMNEFSTRFDAHLREYGHSIYDLDFAKPTPFEAPEPLVDALKVYLAEKNNPYERQQAAIELREKAAETISRRLDPLRRKYFLKLLKWAQETAPLREDSIANLGLGHPQIRRLLGEFGKRLVEGGAIACAEDIYWLKADEVDGLAILLEKGEPLPSFDEIIERRKAKWQAMRRIIPPATVPKVGWMSKFFPSNEMAGNVINGLGASAGQVTARACVMLGPEDFCKMQPGDVLVAGITTPAWTPLFARAAGIVTDIGGPLSHSSIVAREYGIPAVLATGVGTRRIQDGQTITVDGTAGKVTLHETTTGTEEGVEEGLVIWAPPDPKGIYMRTSIADLMPKPLSPLFISMGIPIMVDQMAPMGKRLTGGTPMLADDYFIDINSFAYMNAHFPARCWFWILFHLLPSYPHMLRILAPLWRDELLPAYQAFVARKQDRSPAQMSMHELWNEIQELFTAAAYYMDGLMYATMGASAGSEGLLTKIYDRMAKQDGDPEASTLLMGWNNIPVRSEKSLYDLAQWVRTDESLADYILKTPSSELAERLAAPASVPAVSFPEFASKLKTHMDSFGHIVFQLDFAEPLPLEHPEIMLESIKMYLRGEGTNPHERQRASEQKRIQTAETVLKRLKGFKRWVFQKALNWGQSMAAVREDALAEIGLAYPRVRALLREMGTRFVQAGAIQKADDIFWLKRDEISACVAGMEDSQMLKNLTWRVEERKTFNQRLMKIVPPPMIPMKKRIMGFKTDVIIAQTEESQAGNVLKGVPTSAGKVTAPACILHGPEDFDRMRPGDVIVAGATTPAWTPLFVMASAVVTDIGGPLSHGSIVAREYGIPAVMGTGVATRRIQNRQVITVDGSAGTVTLS